jgi:hypothetical protein
MINNKLYKTVLYGILLVVLSDTMGIFFQNSAKIQMYDTLLVFPLYYITLVKVLFLGVIATIYFLLRHKDLNKRLAKFHIISTVLMLILIKILNSIYIIPRRYYRFEESTEILNLSELINQSITLNFIILLLVQSILLYFLLKIILQKIKFN